MNLVDRHGRVHDELRISVTDRCNLRCNYCMPEEPVWFPRHEILSYEELARLVRVMLGRGVSRLRITGGEPLLRRDLPLFVELLSALDGVREISVTTNGLRLEEQAADLAAAGLHRINVSLDTLDPARFQQLTRRDRLDAVLRGLQAAAAAGLRPIKINTVLLRGVNDDEILALAAAAREHRWELRFIEFMPLENGETWNAERVVRGDEARRAIDARWPLEPVPGQDPHAPARSFRYVDGGGSVGFIDSVSSPFCAQCSRLRLTADGKLATCLYAEELYDLKTPLRAGATDAELERLIAEAVLEKGPGGALTILERRTAIPLVRTMHQIGG